MLGKFDQYLFEHIIDINFTTRRIQTMRNNSSLIARMTLLPILSLFLLTGCGDIGEGDTAETGDAVDVEVQENTDASGTFAIDGETSKIGWFGARVAGSHNGGFKSFNGTLTVNDGAIAHAKIEIDMATIWSDTEKLTGHLKSADFFEVETYPTAVFEASDFAKVESDSATHQVTGNLTMHGVTKGVSFPANVEIMEGGVKASANFIIDRQQWNVSYAGKPDDLIKDEVRITLEIVAMAEDPVASAK